MERMQFETMFRSCLKALSYRVLSSLATAVLVLVLTRSWSIAFLVGGIEVVGKMAIYFIHERVWNKVPFGKREIEPAVIWFTGLPSSGKTTLAKLAAEELRKRGFRIEHLDGDDIRELLPETGFTREERERHVRRVGLLARYLQRNGVFVVASLISPYAGSRRFVRDLCGKFIEVYVSTPLEECEKRDRKGLYARARRGEIRDFTGVDAPYEAPQTPDMEVDTTKMTQAEAVDGIMACLDRTVLRRIAVGLPRAT